MVYKTKPKNFRPKFNVASCFIEYDGRILLLLRQDHKDRGNLWGAPAGKIEDQENPDEAIARELKEETGIAIKTSEFKHRQTLYIRYPDYDFLYYIFHTILSEEPRVRVDLNEHKDYIWVSPFEKLSLPLVPDEDVCIELCYSNVPQTRVERV